MDAGKKIEALKSYTINAAYGAFEEDIKGSIALGKYADFTVLSQNIITIPDDQIDEGLSRLSQFTVS